VTRVAAALWVDTAPEVVASVYLLCDGWASLQAEVTLPASSLPPHEPDATPGGLTSFALEPALPVVTGDTVVVVFRTPAGRAVSGVYTTNVDPQSKMVFYNGAHGASNPVDWDMVVQIDLD
jgi:hypothetical protein